MTHEDTTGRAADRGHGARARRALLALAVTAAAVASGCSKSDSKRSFSVGGTVSGLRGTGLSLANGADTLAVSADGAFAFHAAVPGGASYDVTVAAQPAGPTQGCTVANGAGTATGNVTNVAVTCVTSAFRVGGTVSGLAGAGLVLQDDNGDDLAVSANGSFTFATAVNSGNAFGVTVKTQPSSPTQTCRVSGGAGVVGAGDVTGVVVNCQTDTFTVGGLVSGLAGGSVVLENAGERVTVNANGSFAFATPVASGTAYAVAVVTQPTSPSQTCVASSEAGTVGGADVTSVRVACTTNTYTIGGTVSGLAGSGLVLRDNGGDPLPMAADGAFTFAIPVASGATYDVSVLAQPSLPAQTCAVSAGSGTVGGANVTGVSIACTTKTYSVGGTITGLVGSGLTLRNGAETLFVAGDGPFAFTAEVASGDTFDVGVEVQPALPSQTCTVSGGAGTVVSAPVTSVVVNCTTNTYTVGGTVSGLAGTLVLQQGGGDDLTLTADGSFAFATPVASGATYSVTVLTQPGEPSQTCAVTDGDGTVGAANVTSVAITCTTNSFAIGGTVTGLAGAGLVLQQSGGDDLAVAQDGTFAFATPVLSGAAYAVSVKAQPANPSQTCVVEGASGTVRGSAVTGVLVTCTTDRFQVGGSVSGLAGSGLVLQDDAGDDLVVAANGTFAFATPVASGATYDVTVRANPTSPWQTCTVSGGSGTIGAGPVTDVAVTCVTNAYAVGGTLVGLAGQGLVLQQSGGDDLAVGQDGTFAFATPVASGAAYAVTVRSQPSAPAQICRVSGGAGTIGGGDVTGVVVNCTTLYAVGGSVSGLAGTVVLQVNGGGDLAVSSNGTFAFATPIESGAAYAVTVLAQPDVPSQTCAVANGTGTVGAADVTSVAVTCVTNRFAIRGTLSGLAPGDAITLQDAGADDLVLGANGAFAFATPVPSGGAYAVTVLADPASPVAQTCRVTNGAGTVGGADVVDVQVSCFYVCTTAVTTTLTVANPYGAPVDVAYTMIGAGGGGAILGAGGSGTVASGSVTLPAGSTLQAWAGGGGGYGEPCGYGGGGGGGSGWYGGGGGANGSGAYGAGGGGGSSVVLVDGAAAAWASGGQGGTTYGAGGGGGGAATGGAGTCGAYGCGSSGVAFQGGDGAMGGRGGAGPTGGIGQPRGGNGGSNGGDGLAGGGTGNFGGCGGGGGGGFGSGGGGYSAGGLGALNWQAATSLPPAAGAGGASWPSGGNAGLVILRYVSPAGACAL